MRRRIFKSAAHLWIVAASAAAVAGSTAAIFLSTQDTSQPWGRFAAMYTQPPVVGIPHRPGDMVLDEMDFAPAPSSISAGPVPSVGLSQEVPGVMGPYSVEQHAVPVMAPAGDDALWRARRLSWRRQFRPALALYDSLLAAGDEPLVLLREKARVLGWMGRYGEALECYGETVRRYPDSAAAAAEADAKAALYDGRYRDGVRAYRRWLDLEPESPEALFDLSQLQYGQQRWADAIALTDRLLKEIPGHDAARQVRRKALFHAEGTPLYSEAVFFHSEGGTRQAELEYLSIASSVARPLNPALMAAIKVDTRFYRFSGSNPDPMAITTSAALTYRRRPDAAVEGFIGSTMKSNGPDNTVTGGLGVQSSPLDDLHLAFRYRHGDVVENAATFLDGLSENSLTVQTLYRPSRKWQAGLEGFRSWYSDGNVRTDYGVELRSHLSYEPTRLTLFWRWDSFGYNQEQPDYFTPGTFNVHHAGVDAIHYFKGDALYGGGNNTSIRMRGSLNFEPSGGRSKSVLAEFRHDWNDRLSSSLLYDRTWNDESGVYSADRMAASLLWYF
ncbi:hypothetical protein Plut_0991 [Pelodictyon luteolum DSM 273]|uniref:Uncharacterized protein n=2 Tax=Pelodictyon luteolum TaxID=1100 RepID=Q3B478_CHLL3|nr:hypothetical protein Plut_0991 [Pelodictyon luteolum DSM 273]